MKINEYLKDFHDNLLIRLQNWALDNREKVKGNHIQELPNYHIFIFQLLKT